MGAPHISFEKKSEIDYHTGEVVREITTAKTFPLKEPPYVKIYLDDLASLLKIPNAQKNVLQLMLAQLDFEGYIALSPRYRKKMCEELGISAPALRNNISKLCKTGIIRRSSYGEYQANPNYFARGKWESILKQRMDFALTVTYKVNGEREIKTEVVQEGDAHLQQN